MAWQAGDDNDNDDNDDDDDNGDAVVVAVVVFVDDGNVDESKIYVLKKFESFSKTMKKERCRDHIAKELLLWKAFAHENGNDLIEAAVIMSYRFPSMQLMNIADSIVLDDTSQNSRSSGDCSKASFWLVLHVFHEATFRFVDDA